MRTAPTSIYPEPAVRWLLGGEERLVLDLGSGNGRFAAMMAGMGHRVHCVETDIDRVRRLVQRVPNGLHCVARPEALPMRSYRFDVVTVQESFTRFPTGPTLAEIARVLKPGGHLAVVYTSRDDTVPWVKRLAKRIQQDDPGAMAGDYGRAMVAALADAAYFPQFEERTFRNWVPIDRTSLLAMVRNRRAIARMSKPRVESLEADLRAVFDSSARPREPLQLPFQAICRRARVDHSDLTQPLETEGLRISMRF